MSTKKIIFGICLTMLTVTGIALTQTPVNAYDDSDYTSTASNDTSSQDSSSTASNDTSSQDSNSSTSSDTGGQNVISDTGGGNSTDPADAQALMDSGSVIVLSDTDPTDPNFSNRHQDALDGTASDAEAPVNQSVTVAQEKTDPDDSTTN